MAARKSSSRKRSSSRSRRRSSGRPLADALGRLELPATLRDYVAQVRKRLDRLERDVARARADARKQAARLLREASHQLGRLEERGEAGWRRLTRPYRRRLVDLLRRLEKALAPPARRKAPRKKTARKKTARRKASRTASAS